MYDLFFPVCAKITLIRQQRTRTNLAPDPPYSMLTLGAAPQQTEMSVYFTTAPPPLCEPTLSSGWKGGAFACVSGLWMSVIFTHTGPLTIDNKVATSEGRGEMDGRMEGGKEGGQDGGREGALAFFCSLARLCH